MNLNTVNKIRSILLYASKCRPCAYLNIITQTSSTPLEQILLTGCRLHHSITINKRLLNVNSCNVVASYRQKYQGKKTPKVDSLNNSFRSREIFFPSINSCVIFFRNQNTKVMKIQMKKLN